MSRLDSGTYVRHTLSTLWDNLPQITLAGFLCSLLGIPTFVLFSFNLWLGGGLAAVLLVAPAWSALAKLQAAMLEGRVTSLGLFLRSYPTYWQRSVRLGSLLLIPLLAARLTLPHWTPQTTSPLLWIGLAADLLGTVVLLALYLYAFPLLVLYELSVLDALRNSLILSSRYLINTTGLASLGLLCAAAIIYLSFALVFILPAMVSLFIVNNCRLVLQEELSADDPSP